MSLICFYLLISYCKSWGWVEGERCGGKVGLITFEKKLVKFLLSPRDGASQRGCGQLRGDGPSLGVIFTFSHGGRGLDGNLSYRVPLFLPLGVSRKSLNAFRRLICRECVASLDE